MAPMDQIVIKGARRHNLKNIDLELPRNRFVVITGVSGSGKSSLAFDTLFSEGRRRYVESLSTHARQMLQRLSAPPVDEIRGLSPAIAIEQKGLPRNPRSTVGTLTEINDYLRLLYARLSIAHCPSCGHPVRAHTVPQMVQEVLAAWPSGSRLLIVAPLEPVPAKHLPKVLQKLTKDGFARIRMDDVVFELDPLPFLPRRAEFRLEVVVDRIVLDESRSRRLTDSFEVAAGIGRGMTGAVRLEGDEMRFSEAHRCVACGYDVPRPTPSLFSFHHPLGTCPECRGLGFLDHTVPEPDRRERIRRPATGTDDGDAGVEKGDGESHPGRTICPSCGGSRLNGSARSFFLGGLGIHEACGLQLPAVLDWLANLNLSPSQALIADRPLQEIIGRLNNLLELGLAYLTLDRAADTLSGGEAQRIRLAHQLSSSLSGVLYVLDEPSIGLHPRDHRKLLDILFRLRDAGNSVIVVEHDRQTILEADHVVDMGPGAGAGGGKVVFSGPPAQMLEHPDSLTGKYLSGRKVISIPPRRKPFARGALQLRGARGHNLKNIDVDFPLGCLICVTGVSGSGKSTLVLHTLYRALARRLHGSRSPVAPFDTLNNAEAVGKILLIDQSPLGRTPRSTPATYSGLFDHIRQVFSQVPEARARGYRPARFSFNAKGGRCEACKGEGLQRIEMYFLPDVYVTCPVCGGTRYGNDTLDILFKGHSIASVLDMTVHEAAVLFENFTAIRAKLDTLIEVGLGYLRLGQPANTLSGGEAQRVKLAAELGVKGIGRALYILDEPTTGLHFEDIERLLHVLQRLVDLGHTVVLIEHHPDVVKTADYVIDLGPEGGEQGGYLIGAGSPEKLSTVESSFTGRYLREILKRTSVPEGKLDGRQ